MNTDRLLDPEIVRRQLRGLGVSPEAAHAAYLRQKEMIANAPPGTITPANRRSQRGGTGQDGSVEWAMRRDGDTLHAEFQTPPRTKKNSTMLGIIQSAAYRRYAGIIADCVAAARDEFRTDRVHLPLPDQPYNLEAVFYVDSHGKTADLFGLLQAIADAIQDAGVLSNDWYFRTSDGSRVVFDDPRPRVEIIITPL